jgi:hypothetical protein
MPDIIPYVNAVQAILNALVPSKLKNLPSPICNDLSDPKSFVLEVFCKPIMISVCWHQRQSFPTRIVNDHVRGTLLRRLPWKPAETKQFSGLQAIVAAEILYWFLGHEWQSRQIVDHSTGSYLGNRFRNIESVSKEEMLKSSSCLPVFRGGFLRGLASRRSDSVRGCLCRSPFRLHGLPQGIQSCWGSAKDRCSGR